MILIFTIFTNFYRVVQYREAFFTIFTENWDKNVRTICIVTVEKKLYFRKYLRYGACFKITALLRQNGKFRKLLYKFSVKRKSVILKSLLILVKLVKILYNIIYINYTDNEINFYQSGKNTVKRGKTSIGE